MPKLTEGWTIRWRGCEEGKRGIFNKDGNEDDTAPFPQGPDQGIKCLVDGVDHTDKPVWEVLAGPGGHIRFFLTEEDGRLRRTEGWQDFLSEKIEGNVVFTWGEDDG
jgi:hypothetical protein